jgi:hypothetical protein
LLRTVNFEFRDFHLGSLLIRTVGFECADSDVLTGNTGELAFPGRAVELSALAAICQRRPSIDE